MVPRTDFTSTNLGTGRPTIQCTACGEYSHWRRECPYDNFCTTCNNHNYATHMCRAPKHTPKQSPVTCIYCGSTEYSSIQCCNRCVPPEATRDQEFQCTNDKISGKAGFQPSKLKEGQVNHIPTGHTAKFWEVPVLTNQTIMIMISFLGKTRTTAVTREEIQLQVLVDTSLENNYNIIMLRILVQISGITGTSQEDLHSPMLGLMRDTTSSTLHPYTHLHLH